MTFFLVNIIFLLCFQDSLFDFYQLNYVVLGVVSFQFTILRIH